MEMKINIKLEVKVYLKELFLLFEAAEMETKGTCS